MSLLLIQGSAGALLAWLGVWSIAGDLRAKKVQNSRVLKALAGLAVLYAALAVLDRPPAWDLARSSLNAGVCLAAALGLWGAGVWPAGDAKFFFLLGALIPLVDPAFPAAPRSLFLVLLINIFVPAAALSLERALRYSLRPDRRAEAWKELAARLAERIGSAFPAAAVVYVCVLSLGGRLTWLRGPWASIALPLALSSALGAALRGRWKPAPSEAGIALGLATALALRLDGLAGALGLARLLAWFAGLQLAVLLVELDRWKKVPAASIEAGMRVNQSRLRETLGRSCPGLYERHFSVFYADGLLPEQARFLRRWCRRAKVGELESARTIPFVPYMAAGGLLTLALRGDCLSALRYWLGKLL